MAEDVMDILHSTSELVNGRVISKRIPWLVAMFLLTGCGSCEPAAEFSTDTSTPDVGRDAGSEVADAGTEDQGRDDHDLFEFDFGDRDMGPEDTGPVVLRVDAVVPPRGKVTGGTPIAIQGSGFTDESVVYFGSRPADVELVDGQLVGQTPAGAGTGPVNVKVLDPTYGDEVLEDGFEYVPDLAVDAVTPGRVSSGGGVEVSVTGRGFDDDTRVSFGGATGVRHVTVDENLMRVVVGPHAAGTFDVRATNRAATSTLSDAITFFDAVGVDSVRPATGAPAGGDTVVLSGTGFTDPMTVEFDGVPATVQNVEPAAGDATVVTPPHPAGAVDVRVQTPAGDAAIAPDAFYYAAAGTLAVGSIEPRAGPAVGGTEVTLIGAGLDATSLSVTFDGAAATIVDQGPGHVVVQTPAHAVGAVDVTVSDGVATDTAGFTYVENLWIDRVAPDEGDVAGGETVVLSGEGFTGVTDVRFGGMSASFTVDSDTQITATTPAHTAGVVDVVARRGEIDATFRDGYTFGEDLEVFGTTPARGSIAGGTYVLVRGRGFVGDVEVMFDGLDAPFVELLDAQTLAVRTPPHPTGLADVEVSVPSQSAASPEPFAFYNPGSRFGGAWGSPIRGSVNVTVFDRGGAPIESAFVMLSTNAASPYTGYTDAQGMITLSGPDVFGEQTVSATGPCLDMGCYGSATVQHVDAENVTVFLSPPPPPPSSGGGGDPPPRALFTGRLSGLDKLAEPGPNEFQLGIVTTTQRDAFTPNPPPGDGNTIQTSGRYSIQTRVGDLALVAVGGLYNNDTDTFKPLMMGVARYQFAANGEVYNVDIDLDIELNESLQYKLNNIPSWPDTGPNVVQVETWMDFGFEGVWPSPVSARPSGNVYLAEHQAPLTGELSDVTYMAVGGAYRQPDNTDFQTYPQSEGYVRNIATTDGIQEIPGLVGIAKMTSPSAGEVAIDRLFEFDLIQPNEPDFYWAVVADPRALSRGAIVPRWEIFLPGDQTSFRLPDFPAFSQLPAEQQPAPYPGGEWPLLIFGIQKDAFDFDRVSYNDLAREEWEAYSLSSTNIKF